MADKEYELLSPVNFGDMHYDEEGKLLHKDNKPDYAGLQPAGEKLTLPEEVGEPLVEVGSAKYPDDPKPFVNQEPEEYGYEGEAARDEALKEDSGEAEPNATPAAMAKAKELGVDVNQVKGSGKDGKVLAADVEAHNK